MCLGGVELPDRVGSQITNGDLMPSLEQIGCHAANPSLPA